MLPSGFFLLDVPIALCDPPISFLTEEVAVLSFGK